MAQAGRFLAWLLLVVLGLLGCGCRAERDCRVSNIRVQENFDKARVGVRSPPRSLGLALLGSCQILP